MSTFKELLQASFKSADTEEWLDVHFTRPVGLFFALIWIRLGVHPNAITLLSIVLGAGAGFMFYHTDLWHNVLGVLLLMLANFCDSTDGQMARLTGQKTLIGRMLDGFSGDVWFFCIYVAICLRLQGQFIPFTEITWGVWIWLLGVIAGVFCHSPQSSLADYYRQIHLFFLLGKKGSELDNYAQQRAIYESLPRDKWLDRLFYFNYANYCRSQEKRTPHFQKFIRSWNTAKEQQKGEVMTAVGARFLQGSRPLMPFTNLLTFNARAITIYITCLANCPWVYLLVEIVFFSLAYRYMHQRHEMLCAESTKLLEDSEVHH